MRYDARNAPAECPLRERLLWRTHDSSGALAPHFATPDSLLQVHAAAPRRRLAGDHRLLGGWVQFGVDQVSSGGSGSGAHASPIRSIGGQAFAIISNRLPQPLLQTHDGVITQLL